MGANAPLCFCVCVCVPESEGYFVDDRTTKFISRNSKETKKKSNAAALVKKSRGASKKNMALGSDLPRVLEVSRLVAAREPEVRARERARD